MPTEADLAELRAEIEVLRTALITLIAWLAQARTAPINYDDALRLIRMARGTGTGDEASRL